MKHLCKQTICTQNPVTNKKPPNFRCVPQFRSQELYQNSSGVFSGPGSGLWKPPRPGDPRSGFLFVCFCLFFLLKHSDWHQWRWIIAAIYMQKPRTACNFSLKGRFNNVFLERNQLQNLKKTKKKTKKTKFIAKNGLLETKVLISCKLSRTILTFWPKK